jgi:hypothetical protein
VRPEQDYRAALKLIKEGVNDCEVGRRLGIPRGTVRDWRVGLEAGSGGRTESFSGQRKTTCFRCNDGWVDSEAYAYLLGAYLGDGWICSWPRGVYQLRISCDLKYPDIISEIATHIVIVRGVERVGFASKTGRCIDVNAFWKHWPCVFPQHGVGRKHERRIQLATWQREIVAAHPKLLVRGLIHSDGCRHINEVKRREEKRREEKRLLRRQALPLSPVYVHEYIGGHPPDLHDHLDALDVHWTRTTARDISIARREDVAFLDTFVGPKS